MNKILLLGASFLMSGSMLAMEPEVIDNLFGTNLSPNGEWLIGQGSEVSVIIRNLVTGEEFVYDGEKDGNAYGIGSGNVVSNNGVVVGTTDNMNACYWENGSWHKLNILDKEATNVAHSVTPDGGIICGNVGQGAITIDATKIMALPALWYREGDGSYGDPVVLPHPEVDFSGRLPQYVSAVGISNDGKTVIGQMMDYSGFVVQPILYTCDENGEWTYSIIHPELMNPNGVKFPEYPGEFDMEFSYETYMTPQQIEDYQQAIQDYFDEMDSLVAPEPVQFMSYQGYQDYLKALNEYYETWEDFPDYKEFMTEAELAEYEEALAEYEEIMDSLEYPEFKDFMTEDNYDEYIRNKAIYDKAYAEWEEKYYEFEDAFYECLEDGYTYLFNNFKISGDGKIAVTTRQGTVENDDPMAWMPFKSVYYPISFNLEDGTFTQYVNAEDLIMSYISDDYSILLKYQDTNYILPSRAYIIPQLNGEDLMPIEDFVAMTSPETAEWMEKEMTHSVIIGVNELTWEYIYADFMCSGLPTSTPDLSLFATTIENSWSDSPVDYYTYLFSTGESGVNKIADESEYGMKVASGRIFLTGSFRQVEVYSISGEKVFSLKNPGASVETNLGKGMYIVRATTADGNSRIAKVVF